MNNSNNTIVGIGLVVNYLKRGKSYNIYNDKNYNRYVYQSKKFRIDKSQFRANEESLIKYTGTGRISRKKTLKTWTRYYVSSQ